MRLVFIGAVEGSRRALEALLSAGAPVVRVVTLHGKYARRHSDFADLAAVAESHDVAVTRVDNVNDAEVIATLRGDAPDYVLVIGWSQLLGEELLSVPSRGTIGFHPTLLPKHRGRAALPWTILNGLTESGVTLFHIDGGTDSGDIIYQKPFALAPDETVTTLYAKVAEGVDGLMRDLARDLASGKPLPRQPQDHAQATWTARRTKNDGLIDWQRPADEVWALIRATTRPFPGAFTFHKDRRLIVWSAEPAQSAHIAMPGQVACLEAGGPIVQCGQGQLRLLEVQPGDGPAGPAAEYFRKPHEKLGINWLKIHDEWRKLKARPKEKAKEPR